MAARVDFENANAPPTRSFSTMLREVKATPCGPNLLVSALRNSLGTKISQQVASSPVVHAAPPTVPVLNLTDFPIATRVRALELQRRQQLLLSTANRRLPPGCQVMVWSIVPLELFQGELGRFLMIACDFYGYGPENTMLLPTMPVGAQHLDLPRHPLVVSEDHIKMASAQISALRNRVAADHGRANLAMQNGDLSQLFSRTDSKQRYCKELTNTVENIAKARLNHNVMQNHQSHFGALISAM